MIATNSYSYLEAATRKLSVASHMLYVTFPVVKDSRLLVKILNELHLSAAGMINAVLEHEHSHRRIILHEDKDLNFNTFRNKSASKFGISQEEILRVNEIFYLIERHRKSPMEFVRQDRFVIMSDELDASILSIEKLKSYANIISGMLKKARRVIETEDSTEG